MFVDTSAIIAILCGEPAADQLEQDIDDCESAITSPLVILEATMVLSTRLTIEPDVAETRVRHLLNSGSVAITVIDDETASQAIKAFQHYGKGRRSGARLNLADCLSYACAKQHRVPLLYVGDDFARTDLA